MFRNTCTICGEFFKTKKIKQTECDWTCVRVGILKRHPVLAMKSASWSAFAYEQGYAVAINNDGIRLVSRNVDKLEELWRKDVDKIIQRAHLKGRYMSESNALLKAARNASGRASSKHPSERRTVLKRKAQGLGHGEVRIKRTKER